MDINALDVAEVKKILIMTIGVIVQVAQSSSLSVKNAAKRKLTVFAESFK